SSSLSKHLDHRGIGCRERYYRLIPPVQQRWSDKPDSLFRGQAPSTHAWEHEARGCALMTCRSSLGGQGPGARLPQVLYDGSVSSAGSVTCRYSDLTHPLSWLPWLAKFRHHDVSAVRPGGEQHALADAKAHLAGLQIGYHDHLFTDQVLRAIRLPDTGENSALLAANIHPQAQQLVSAFHRFGVQHRGHAQVDCGKLVVGNLGCQLLYRHLARGWLLLRFETSSTSGQHGLDFLGINSLDEALELTHLVLLQGKTRSIVEGQRGNTQNRLHVRSIARQDGLDQGCDCTTTVRRKGTNRLSCHPILFHHIPRRGVLKIFIANVSNSHNLLHGTVEL